MLQITIRAEEQWDEVNSEFVNRYPKEQPLQLEHSLISLSKWESKWHKYFLGNNKTTSAEMIDYVRCMTLTSKVDPEIYNFLTSENIAKIKKYIDNPMTATVISKRKGNGGIRRFMTSEIIYCYMVTLGIPFECEKWHLNRLITLIEVCNIENQPLEKQRVRETMSQNSALNDARRNRLKTKG